MRRNFFVLIFSLILTITAQAQTVDPVLLLGPVDWSGRTDWNKTDHGTALKNNFVRQLTKQGLPSAAQTHEFFGQTVSWREQAGGLPGRVLGQDGIVVLSWNMETDRFMKGTLKTGWTGAVDLYLNGTKVSGSGKEGFKLTTPTGSHHLLLLMDTGQEAEGNFELNYTSDHGEARFHTASQRRVSDRLLYHTPTISNLDVSPDGRWYSIAVRGRDSANDRWQTRTAILSAAGQVHRQWLGDAPRGIQWRPDSKAIAYRTGKNIWLEDIASGTVVPLLEGVEGLGPFRWSPNGKTLFVHLTHEGEKPKKGIKRYRALEDRWSGWRDQRQIYAVDVESGLMRQLTEGEEAHNLTDISEDGRYLLINRSVVDYSQPPHTKDQLLRLDLNTMEMKSFGDFWALGTARFAPEGQIYLTGGPELRGNQGKNLPAGVVPNNYDSQLYLFNPDTQAITPLSKDFKPSIGSMRRTSNGDLVLTVTERDTSPLYLFQYASRNFKALASAGENVGTFAVTQTSSPTVYWTVQSAVVPQKLFRAVLPGGSPELVMDPSEGAYDQVKLGEVKTWTFTNRHGEEIDGRIHTPPDFDPAKKYPLIVYYYGGTVPVGRSFTGRYPFNLWNAQGYVIYVVQPAGTIGYGQAFSAKHVNAWGLETAEDIIEGVKAFTAAHDYVDAAKIGCIGASYGGFMTMYLQTRTDLFATAISHAGISSLTGYWGKGWWGYAYSGIASRNSFPWNNPELYTEQSPVFAADKIQTPLLLLTGDADTNVPPEQSHTMYTALKLLGKEVELITVEGEDHWILEHDKRLVWWDTILAWFDKHLKDQPEWWQTLYPE